MDTIMFHCRSRISTLKGFSKGVQTGRVLDDDPHSVSAVRTDKRSYSHPVRREELGSLGGSLPMGDVIHIMQSDYCNHFGHLSVVVEHQQQCADT